MDKNLTEITIPAGRFEELTNAEATLSALEAAGVDNWEGYDHAMEILNENTED
jgi:hypothetical protein